MQIHATTEQGISGKVSCSNLFDGSSQSAKVYVLQKLHCPNHWKTTRPVQCSFFQELIVDLQPVRMSCETTSVQYSTDPCCSDELEG